jgi:carbon-monoxide dehydrogenase medium subunit
VKPPPFAYSAPDTLDEALDLLAELGDEAKVIAGGQSLMPMLAMRLARPSHLVDLNRVRSMSTIRDDGDLVSIGAMARERAAERSSVVAARVPVMAQALPLVGHVSIRNRGTVGGSIAHADASAELPAVAMVTDAELVLRRRGGERVVTAEEFLVSHYTTVLEADECLVEVRVPTTPPGAGWAFEEVARRHGDFALVGVAAMVTRRGDRIERARVCLFGVADRPVRVPAVEASLAGAAVGDDTFAAAATDAAAGLEPASDMHGTAGFRRHLAEVTVRRALSLAAERAS